ncbi:hypothetical protein [Couchioplanes caeruleus]|uniref:Uncharacterized protein n=1 Tax=Couchioplanes caeruleus TaxID=56438 RepID=A0A3N1GJI0_9ACTN|nr:hypothetical protein [Couchioplanes caeruleus]ROP30306.1 hypothetical protein EDD30_3147 [Couchioplanes caeruleus]
MAAGAALVGVGVAALLPEAVRKLNTDANFEKVRPDPAAMLLNPAFGGR